MKRSTWMGILFFAVFGPLILVGARVTNPTHFSNLETDTLNIPLTETASTATFSVDAAGHVTATTLCVNGEADVDSNLYVGGSPNFNDSPHYRTSTVAFYDVDVAASQTDIAWGMDASAGVGGASFKTYPAAFRGSIIGISIYCNAVSTAGSLVAEVYYGGSDLYTATGLSATISAASGKLRYSTTTQASGLDVFGPCGNVPSGGLPGLIQVHVTTSADWDGTSVDAIVVVTLAEDDGTGPL